MPIRARARELLRRGETVAPSPILGRIEEPAGEVVPTGYRAQRFRGWAAVAGGEPVTVRLIGPEGPLAEQLAELPRPDVPEAVRANRGLEVRERCGFELDLVLPDDRSTFDVEVRLAGAGTERVAGTFRFELLDKPTRAAYRRTWSDLVADEDSAKGMVAGTVEERTFEHTAEATLAQLDRTIGIREDDTVLEIGCGVGRVGAVVAPRCRRWIGTDVSREMLDRTRARLANREGVSLVEVSGWDLAPIEDSSVDVVYCTVVFMHLDEWDRYQYVLEARRILRPGGRLYVDNYNLMGDGGWNLFLELKEGFHPLARPAAISRSSTPQELETYLRRAGFEGVETSSEEFWTYAWGRKPSGP